MSTMYNGEDIVMAAGGRLIHKDGWFWGFLHYLVLIVTFGGNRKFRTGYVTTIGPIVAVPTPWRLNRINAAQKSTLEHEAVHIKQFRKAGLGSAWLGILPMAFVYLLFPLPFFFALGRFWIERSAYAVTMANYRDNPELSVYYERKFARVVHNMTSGNYGWPLPPFNWARAYARRSIAKRMRPAK